MRATAAIALLAVFAISADVMADAHPLIDNKFSVQTGKFFASTQLTLRADQHLLDELQSSANVLLRAAR